MSRKRPESTVVPETVIHKGIPDQARPGQVVVPNHDVEFPGGHPFTVDAGQRIFLGATMYEVTTWETLETENRGKRRKDDVGPFRAFGYRRVGEEPGKPQFIIRP